MKNEFMNYQKLECITHSESSKQRISSLTSTLSKLWNWLIEAIITANELNIYSIRSKAGTTYWAVYEPRLGRKLYFDSESDIRAWLDRRYYDSQT